MVDAWPSGPVAPGAPGKPGMAFTLPKLPVGPGHQRAQYNAHSTGRHGLLARPPHACTEISSTLLATRSICACWVRITYQWGPAGRQRRLRLPQSPAIPSVLRRVSFAIHKFREIASSILVSLNTQPIGPGFPAVPCTSQRSDHHEPNAYQQSGQSHGALRSGGANGQVVPGNALRALVDSDETGQANNRKHNTSKTGITIQ